jgi:uncharacterized protein DUF3618
MVERPDQIERHIESARSELGSNLHELETKVRQAADWRTYFERNPMTLMGLAFGGGVLLASVLGTKNGAASIVTQEQYGKNSLPGSRNYQVTDPWSTLKGALIGLAGTKVRNLLNEALPGFSEQYERMERENSASASSHTQGREFESSAHRT